MFKNFIKNYNEQDWFYSDITNNTNITLVQISKQEGI
jgi:hypothetical protein